MNIKFRKNSKILVPVISILTIAGFLGMLFATTEPEQKKYGSNALNLEFSASKDVGYEDITEEIVQMAEPVVKIENDNLRVAVTHGGVIVITDKKTNKSWSNSDYKNIKESISADSDESISPISVGYQKEQLNETIMFSQKDAVDRNQYKIFKSNNSLRVEYILGENVQVTSYPMAVEKTRFDTKVLSKISAEDKEYLLRRYTLFEYKTIKDKDLQKTLIQKYPKLKEKPFYIATNMDSKIKVDRVLELLASVEYGTNDLKLDSAASGEKKNQTREAFKVAIDYKIEGNDLLVRIPSDSLEFYQANPLVYLDLFKFFSIDSEESGFALIPQGSGAILEYGDKERSSNLAINYFGNDYSEMDGIFDTKTGVNLPVFGVSSNNGGYFAIIESGAEIAQLKIDQSKKDMAIYPRFNLLSYGYASLTGTEKSLVFADDRYKKDIVVRYTLISKPNISFAGMAEIYRDYLKKNKVFNSEALSETQQPIYNVVCGIAQKTKVLKIFPKYETKVLTSADEYQKIKSELPPNAILKLSGVNENGLLSEISSQNQFARGFESIVKEDNLFINKNFTVNYGDRLFDDYNPGKDNLRLSDLSVGTINLFSSALKLQDVSRPRIELVKPAGYVKSAMDFSNLYKGFNLSVGDLTCKLNSDYNKKQYYSRGETLDAVVDALTVLKIAGAKLIGSNANAYTFKYLDYIENISISSNGGAEFTREVPFLQMVLHGNLPYYSADVNASDDARDFTLKAIAYGSGLKFSIAKNISQDLAQSDFAYLYYTDYEKNKTEMLEMSELSAQALQGLANVQIANFEESERGISCTSYENGVKIYVNRTDKDQAMGAIKIPALSFVRIN